MGTHGVISCIALQGEVPEAFLAAGANPVLEFAGKVGAGSGEVGRHSDTDTINTPREGHEVARRF